MAKDFPYVQIPDALRPILGEQKEGTRVYVQAGDAELFGRWHDAICKHIGPTISPGGACARAHVTRAGVHKRMKDGKLTAFWFEAKEPRVPTVPVWLRFFQPRTSFYILIPSSECRAWGELVAAKYKRLQEKKDAGQFLEADEKDADAYNEEIGDCEAAPDLDFVKDALAEAKKKRM